MERTNFFVDRRHRQRRQQQDPCEDLPLDLYHRKRRRSGERRTPDRSLADDYRAFMAARPGRAAVGGKPEVE